MPKQALTCRLGLLVLLLACSLAGAMAQVPAHMPDPMRPSGLPPEMLPREGVEAGVQTVILPANGRPAAVVNGGLIRQGDRFGEQRVASITESEVVLVGRGRTDVLRTTPAVRKTPRPRVVVGKAVNQPPVAGKERAKP